jgi:tight adherence protein C
MEPTTALILIGVVTALIAFLGMALLGLRDEREDTTEEPARPLFGPANGALAGLLPSTDAGRAAIQQDLWMAGYNQPAALNNFLVVRNLFTIVPLVMGLASALMASDFRYELNIRGAIYRPPEGLFYALLGVVFAILGYSIPRLVLRSLAKSRQERLERGLPVLIDTLGMCLSSGNGVTDSLGRAGEAIRRGHRDLSNEVRVVKRQAELRSLDHALMQWKKRIPLPEVAGLVFLLSSSDRYGTGVVEGLHELSANYRTNARQRAEAAANRTNFYLLFPTVLCLVTAAGLMLIGPPLHLGLRTLPEVQKHFDEASGRKNDLQAEFERLRKAQLQAGGFAPPPAPEPPAVPES